MPLFQMKTLRGKYQIKPNTFVACHLEVEEATEKEWRVYVGITRRADRRLPPGTRILIDPVSFRQGEGASSRPGETGAFETFALTVHEPLVYAGATETVHLCSGLQRETHADRRRTLRRDAFFPMALGEDFAWQVVNASPKGLALSYQSNTPVLSMALGREYSFQALHKGQSYAFPLRLRHIHSNWESFTHTLGFETGILNVDQETVLNLLIDPAYTIALRDSEVDAGEGRIRGT
ncbi:MAG: hypothetical protein IPK79_05920 [Vampirovibrionales bacterium]|nr:hypothetical protein [Vampirovibrionales bacterium]